MIVSTTRLAFVCLLAVLGGHASAQELVVGKACPVLFEDENLGTLVFSREWYHSGRTHAAYIASDNATGVGVEIHFFANRHGALNSPYADANSAACDRYRILQVRETTARLFNGEEAVQVDIPKDFDSPFYDTAPLEHGYGSHKTPLDDQDKPWSGRPGRSSTVAIYDTPYVSDYYGVEGQDIDVIFETCVVCQRLSGYDSILSCGRWGYNREYLGGMTGWTEPEFRGAQCQARPSEQFERTLRQSSRLTYSYWLDWR